MSEQLTRSFWNELRPITPANLNLMCISILDNMSRIQDAEAAIVGMEAAAGSMMSISRVIRPIIGDGENSILFNNVTSNDAYGNNGAVFGKQNVAGVYGYCVKELRSQTAGQYQLTLFNPDDSELPYAVGDVVNISLFDKNHYIGIFQIKSIDSNTQVTLEVIPGDVAGTTVPYSAALFDYSNFSTSTADSRYVCYVQGKPGPTRLVSLSEQLVSGSGNAALNDATAVFGSGNSALGPFSFIAGLNNVGGYSVSVFGKANKVLGHSSFCAGNNNTVLGKNIFCAGQSNTAAGTANLVTGAYNVTKENSGYSLMLGQYNILSSSNALIVGLSNVLTANHAIVLGSSNTVGGVSSLCVGSSNEISALDSNGYAVSNALVTGQSCVVSGSHAFAGGFRLDGGKKTTASGKGAFAYGRSAQALGTASAAFGASTTAGGDFSFAAGISSEATKEKAVAIGDSVRAYAIGQIALGRYNKELTGSYKITINGREVELAEYIEVVGVGTPTTRKNGRTLDRYGNGWFAGELKVGGDGPTSTNAKVVATQEYVNNKIQVMTQSAFTTYKNNNSGNDGDVVVVVS